MTKNELKFLCESQIEQIETWKWTRERPHGKFYEACKFILELLDENKLLVETLNECSRKRGKWKHNKCSVCGASRPPLFDNYCPNCGSKMVNEVENEDV